MGAHSSRSTYHTSDLSNAQVQLCTRLFGCFIHKHTSFQSKYPLVNVIQILPLFLLFILTHLNVEEIVVQISK
jgi:hypothetical protein